MPPAKTLLCVLAAVTLVVLGPAARRVAASPADQYVMFVTDTDLFPSPSNPMTPILPLFGSIEAADFYVNSFADSVLFDWDGSTNVFKAVMSISTMPAITRFNHLQAGKPILNTLGQPIVASFPDLFQGDSTTLLAPILEEFGTAAPANTPIWTGTLSNGNVSASTCINWTDTGTFGTIGRTGTTDATYCQQSNRACNLGARIYRLGVLESPRAPGDYNDDGSVDAADYAEWRDTLGETGLLLPADGNGSGTVDPADFDEWRAHFGETPGTASSAVTAVPEPSACVLLATLSFALMLKDMRRPAK